MNYQLVFKKVGLLLLMVFVSVAINYLFSRFINKDTATPYHYLVSVSGAFLVYIAVSIYGEAKNNHS